MIPRVPYNLTDVIQIGLIHCTTIINTMQIAICSRYSSQQVLHVIDTIVEIFQDHMIHGRFYRFYGMCTQYIGPKIDNVGTT